MAVRLVLIDDHPVMLEGLEQLLRLEPDFEVLAKCSTVADGLRAIQSLHPHVVVLDLMLRHEHGHRILQHQLRSRAGPGIVVLTASENEEDLLEAVRLGARGIVLKAMAATTLEKCIRAVYEGGQWLTVDGQDLSVRLAQRQRAEAELAERLTPREVEILRNLAAQLDNDEIARNFRLSVGTVKIHLHHIYTKLGVTGREGLLKYLRKKGY
jgi:DNA-binding NarL/FixJ family response regulator